MAYKIKRKKKKEKRIQLSDIRKNIKESRKFRLSLYNLFKKKVIAREKDFYSDMEGNRDYSHEEVKDQKWLWQYSRKIASKIRNDKPLTKDDLDYIRSELEMQDIKNLEEIPLYW